MRVGILKSALAVLTGVGLSSLLISAQSGQKESFDPAAYYQTNCGECHGKEAQKKFEPALPESQLIDAILNGEKMETPPDMPAFGEKGVNEVRARALLAYMKSIRE
jgi:mono/diheme cytochrome c family protein